MRDCTVTQWSPGEGQTVTYLQGLNNREAVLLLSVKPLRSTGGGGERGIPHAASMPLGQLAAEWFV